MLSLIKISKINSFDLNLNEILNTLRKWILRKIKIYNDFQKNRFDLGFYNQWKHLKFIKQKNKGKNA